MHQAFARYLHGFALAPVKKSKKARVASARALLLEAGAPPDSADDFIDQFNMQVAGVTEVNNDDVAHSG